MPYQIPLSVWSHVSMTYSLTSGIRLYFNGIPFYNGYSGIYSDYTASSQMTTITIGNGLLPSACTSSQTKIYPAQFQGKIDELKIYSRELSATEVYQLFHT